MKRIKTFTLKNKLGLHARAAATIVNASSRYDSRVFLEKDGKKIDGKSILDILTLACPMGSRITVEADGLDADDVMKELEELVENKFGEE
ncbi:MAG: HPr family phosphocarrier protein [Deltaproteobacteria bacterium]|nr:HPr family phosphocarrier protein [Deltaproteobacteria bacterium]MBW2594649.1 HPr family phosphocarrier protein [Deltaproteobacteria bacterium]MBW2649501.1 HPr family phosphocarrier protein [Deltaproteobacteria bacterium]